MISAPSEGSRLIIGQWSNLIAFEVSVSRGADVAIECMGSSLFNFGFASKKGTIIELNKVCASIAELLIRSTL